MIKPNIVKNLLLSVLFVLGIFLIACEEEEEEENPLQGKWSGTYSGGDSGTWEADVSCYLTPDFPSGWGCTLYGAIISSNPTGGIDGNKIYGGLHDGILQTQPASICCGELGIYIIDSTASPVRDIGLWFGKFENKDASGTWEHIDKNGNPIEGTWTGKKN